MLKKTFPARYLSAPARRFFEFFTANLLQVGYSFSAVFCLAYLILPFSFLSSSEKVILLLTSSFVLNFGVYLCVARDQLKHFMWQQVFTKRSGWVLIASLVGAATILALSSSSIPSRNSLEIRVESAADAPSTFVLEELRILGTDGQYTSAGRDRISLDRDCSSRRHVITCTNGSLRFQEFSNRSLQLVIQGHPQGSKISVDWNGINQEIETFRNQEDQFSVVLPYSFLWNRQSFARKSELILLALCTCFSLHLLGIFILNFRAFVNRFVPIQKKGFLSLWTGFALFTLLNLLAFSQYQSHDIFRLNRLQGNSLINLDNGSHDNIKNFQVYVMFGKYFSGRDLIVPPGLLTGLQISESTLKTYSRLNHIFVKDYNPELDANESSSLAAKDKVTIMPAGKIPTRYEFFVHDGDSASPVCTWQMENTVYFLPAWGGLDCQKDHLK